jgi:hypothetical protein
MASMKTYPEPPKVELPPYDESLKISRKAARKLTKTKDRRLPVSKYPSAVQEMAENAASFLPTLQAVADPLGLHAAILLDGGIIRDADNGLVDNPNREHWDYVDWEDQLPRVGLYLADWLPTSGNVCDHYFRRADYCLFWPETEPGREDAVIRWVGALVKHANNTGLAWAQWTIVSLPAGNYAIKEMNLKHVATRAAERLVAAKNHPYRPYYSDAIEMRAAWERRNAKQLARLAKTV